MTPSPPSRSAEFIVRCACGIPYNTSDEHIGKVIKCRCGQRVAVARPEFINASIRTPTQPMKKQNRKRSRWSKVRHWFALVWARTKFEVRGVLSSIWQSLRDTRKPVRYTMLAAWGYVLVICGTWLMLITMSDVYLPGTMLAYGPRAAVLLPLIVIVPLALRFSRSALWPLVLATLIVIGPIMGGRFSMHSLYARGVPTKPAQGTFRVMTFNTLGGGRLALDLRTMLRELAPDVVHFQECGNVLWDSLQAQKDWHAARHQSLCSATRWPVMGVVEMPRSDLQRISRLGFGGTGLVMKMLVSTPEGPIAFVNLHLETARKGLSEFIDENGFLPDNLKPILPGEERGDTTPLPGAGAQLGTNTAIRKIESQRASTWSIGDDPAVPLVVAGDFNLPVESTIFRKYWSTFTDAFEAVGTGFGWSKREGKLIRIRIDHVLVNDAGPKPVRVDFGPELSSDHLPVIADLAWPEKNP